jgi:flagellar hook-associated protein 3 FlgL
MSVVRVSDAQTFTLFAERAGRLQVSLRTLQEQIGSGKRLFSPDDDPLGAAQVVRLNSSLGAIDDYSSSARFGSDVLGAEDKALGEGEQLMVRAEEIATQQASGTLSPSDRVAAREEVHGLLQGLTTVANSELAGRRLFGGLALDAPAPFASPDSSGYTPATAYSGATQDFYVKTGGSTSDRVRLTTRGDTVFTGSLQALSDLENALATGGNVTATLANLSAGRDAIDGERASVGAREAQLVGRTDQLTSQNQTELAQRSRVQDADVIGAISQLTQAQIALQALVAAASQIAQTNLATLLRV